MSALPGFFSTDVRRESGCPVHFVWDGNGRGRPAVRVGFLLALVAGALGSAGLMVHSPPQADALRTASAVVGATAGVLWLVGQALTRLAARAR
jgi:hypothetical protein